MCRFVRVRVSVRVGLCRVGGGVYVRFCRSVFHTTSVVFFENCVSKCFVVSFRVYVYFSNQLCVHCVCVCVCVCVVCVCVCVCCVCVLCVCMCVCVRVWVLVCLLWMCGGARVCVCVSESVPCARLMLV